MPEPSAPTPRQSVSRVASYVIVLFVVVAVVGVAYYQEQLTYGFKLKAWDKDAAGRSVGQFLTAGRDGNRAAADALVSSRELKPLEKNGKWVGYFMVSNAGTLDYMFDELAPPGEPKATSTELFYVGNGSAEVMMPDSKGKAIKYRLEMVGGTWKITEIHGGRPRTSS